MGSSIKICYVAEGKADLYIRLLPTYEWDTAAAHCILLEAGGDLYTPNQTPIRYNQKSSLLNPSFIAIRNQNRHWVKLLKDVKI
jgi:3'(2'), 5'-bisphosphate nucleotidase